MEELDVQTVTKRSIHGIFALVSRTFVIQIISLFANFLLTVFLSPAFFGIFFIVSAIIPFLSYFSDIGLAAALIQKKEPITDKELKTTFTIQQVLVISLSVIALILSPLIGGFYHLEGAGVQLFQALVVAFFLSSLKTIPSIILERNLQFQKLIVPQIVETLFFNIVLLILAIKGFGISSFTYAVLARGISGTIAMYIIAPWKIGFGFSKESAKHLLSFGVPFQLNSVLALIKDDLLIVYLGKALPLAEVGYIGFAQKAAFTPLRLIMDNVIRITFPSFSRLAHDKIYLSKAIDKSLFATSFLVFPSLTGLVVLFPSIMAVFPKYAKWEPAMLSILFFAINGAIASISTPLVNALNAIGKIKISLYLMVFWTLTTWVLTPFSILFFGYNGVAGASAFIALSVVIVVYLVKKHVNVHILDDTLLPFFSAVVMGVAVYFWSHAFVKDVVTLVLAILIGALVYFVLMFVLAREKIKADIQLIRENLKR